MSCEAKFYHYNLVTQPTTTITASNEDAFFPASNIADARNSKVFRTTTGTTSVNVVFDFITTETVNAVLIQGGLDGLGFAGNLTIQANATDSWGAPSFSTTLTPNENFNKGYVSFADQSYRFWRINASNAGEDYVEIGKIFIGAKLVIDANVERNITFGWKWELEDNASIRKNRYGEAFIDEINKLYRITAAFKFLRETQAYNLLDAFYYVGKSKPLWLVVDADENFADTKERFMIYGYLEKIPEATNTHFGLFDISFGIQE